MENLYQRKRNRLEGNLYRQPGAYFITICTQNRKNVFWNQLTTKEGEPLPLNQTGRIAESEILKIGQNGISTVRVEKFVVMPNHVHLLFVVESTSEHACPDIRYVVRYYKRTVSQRLGYSLWQKGFHDRIVRNEEEYRMIWTYIDENPVKWNLDRYYVDESPSV